MHRKVARSVRGSIGYICKRDLDNLLKAIFDSLAKPGVYEDDSQIDKITIQSFDVIKAGVIKLIVKEVLKTNNKEE